MTPRSIRRRRAARAEPARSLEDLAAQLAAVRSLAPLLAGSTFIPTGDVAMITRAELLKPKAEENMSARKGGQPGATCQESDKLAPVDTLQVAADFAGVSRDTLGEHQGVHHRGGPQ